MRLVDNIIRFERHVEGAFKLKDKDISDYFVYNTLAMECFQAVNALIEIGEYVLTKEKLGYPSTYGEIFDILFKNKLLNEETLKGAKRLIFLRNLIAHEEELLEMVSLLLNIKSLFVEEVKKRSGR